MPHNRIVPISVPLSIERIQAAIDFIENNLHCAFDIKTLADVAAMSQWHFQRVFHATVGETVKNYIRARRLSRAATALLESSRNVLDIALEAGFDSNEAFTRAFRAQFTLAPREFRRHRQAPAFPQMKPQIKQAYLEHVHRNVGMTPRIASSPAFKLIGLKADLTVPHEQFDMRRLAQPVWQEFSARLGEIAGRVDDKACLLFDIVSSSERDIRVFILPCVEASDFCNVPKDMIALVRPQLHDAIFSHGGSGVCWEYTMHYIFGSWLPDSPFRLANAAAFCRFAPDRSPFSARAELEYHVALRPPLSPQGHAQE